MGNTTHMGLSERTASTRKAPSTRRKRRLLALQLFAALAVPVFTTAIDAAPVDALESVAIEPISFVDDFLDSTSEPVTPGPVVQETDASAEAAALLNQAVSPPVAPTVTPDGPVLPSRLDAPSFNLSPNSGVSSLGATMASFSAAPAMMGDFFGGSFIFDSGFAIGAALAGGDRRFKIAENVSPMPRDRVYFNYNHFHNALTSESGDVFSLDRFAFGMERTFSENLFSWEVRLPFASALNSTFDTTNPIPQNTELGNVGLGLKALLLTTDTLLVSAGTTLTLPTGDDFVRQSFGVTDYTIENDAAHLAPYLGFLATPNRNWFVQGFMQMDFDLRGNDVVFGGAFQGRLQDQNLMFVDLSAGRWLARRNLGRGRMAGLAMISELHYTMTMNDADFVSGFGNQFEHIDVLNTTLGMHIQYGLAALRIGAAAPLRDEEEKLFDAEVFVQISRAI